MSLHLYDTAFGFDDSDSEIDEAPIVPRFEPREDEEKRIVRSAKDKRFEEIQTVIRNLNNHKKIKDMSNVITDFEELVKLFEKSRKLNELDASPKFYICCIAQLEEFVNESWEQKKTLNKPAAKALSTLKQKVKKYNKDFEESIRHYYENPDLYEEAVDEPDLFKSEDEDESTSARVETDEKSQDPTKKIHDLSDESDDSFMFDESDFSSDSEIKMEKYADDPAAYFIKRDDSESVKDKKKKKPKKVKLSKKNVRIDEEEDTVISVNAEWRPEPLIQAFEKGTEITFELIIKKLSEIISNRGKKTTSISDQITLLEQVAEKIEELRLGVGIHLKTLLSLITVLFDYESKHPAFMPISKFNKAIVEFKRLFKMLDIHRNDVTISEHINYESESLAIPPYFIQGSVLAAVCRLDDEYYKILQNANGHEAEYDERLKDEQKICEILDNLCDYCGRIEAPPEILCQCFLRKIEHIYYKFDYDWSKRVEAEGLETVGPCPSYTVIEHLCQYIYKHDTTDRLRTRAILCHIYFLALFDYWYKARDLILMSNLQASIEHADQSTMILYNRALVQLGLCAFRKGHFKEAHNVLSDFTGSGRIKELLAQGFLTQSRYEKTPEDEKKEKALQVPYHMHINIELIECIFLICAMIQEMPALTAYDNDPRGRGFSKAFVLALRIHDRSTLVGPPETPRDHVIAATKSMRVGNWRACLGYIFNPKMTAKIWGLFNNSLLVKSILENKIKEECLRCYLLTFNSVHQVISLPRLAEHFELPKSLIYSSVSRMIINQDLAASLEVPDDFLIIHEGRRSHMQSLALQLANKCTNIVEMNEKLIENRGGISSTQKGGQSYQGNRRLRLIQGSKFM